MTGLGKILKRFFRCFEAFYRRVFRLRSVGPILLLGQTRYRGPAREFPDGTRLHPGERLGVLHIDNTRITSTEQGVAFRFGRLLKDSLRMLAAQARSDPSISKISIYRGVTWLRPHGTRVGFLAEPLPEGLRSRLLQAHFRFLLWALTGPRKRLSQSEPSPYVYWLTRTQLLRHFGEEREQWGSETPCACDTSGTPGKDECI